MTGEQLAWAGLVAGVLSLVVAVGLYLKSRKPKQLEYDSLNFDPFLPHEVEGWESLSVTFADKQVNNARFALVSVRNTGKVEIRKEDFDQLISVNLTGETTIVTQRLSLLTGDHVDDYQLLGPEESSEHRCVAPAALLNPGDSIQFFFLLDGKEPMCYSVSGRLAGTELRRSKKGEIAFPEMPDTINRDIRAVLFALAVVLAAVGAGIAISSF